MFAYVRNMQLAASDRMRRVGQAAGAGVVLTLGTGFLLAALWTYLAQNLGWGPMLASLAIGGVLAVMGLILLGVSRAERYPVPSTEELRVEVEQQFNLMANTALSKVTEAAGQTMDRAAAKAGEVIDLAENRVHSVADNLGYRANRMADMAETKVYGTARHLSDQAAQRFGFAPVDQGAEGGPRLGQAAPILGALALGITLASRLQDWRHRDDTPHA